MIGGVTGKGGEVVRVVRRAEFLSPHMRAVEKMVAEHVQDRNHAYYRAKQIGPLGHCSTDEQSGIRSAKNRELFRRASSGRNEPFCRAQKVVVSSLPIPTLGRVVPIDTEFRSASDIRQRKQAPAFGEKSHKNAELRRHGDAVPAIGSHDGWVHAAVEYVSPAHEKHGNPRPVLRGVADLSVAEACRIKWNAFPGPERPFAGNLRVSKDADRLG